MLHKWTWVLVIGNIARIFDETTLAPLTRLRLVWFQIFPCALKNFPCALSQISNHTAPQGDVCTKRSFGANDDHKFWLPESQRRLLPLLPSCVSATSYADENKNQLVETGTANFQFSHRRNLNLTHYSHLLSSVLKYTFDHARPTCCYFQAPPVNPATAALKGP